MIEAHFLASRLRHDATWLTRLAERIENGDLELTARSDVARTVNRTAVRRVVPGAAARATSANLCEGWKGKLVTPVHTGGASP